MGKNIVDTQRRLQELLYELKAINLWDREYAIQDHHDSIEAEAWKARRLRVVELQRELLRIVEKMERSISSRRIESSIKLC